MQTLPQSKNLHADAHRMMTREKMEMNPTSKFDSQTVFWAKSLVNPKRLLCKRVLKYGNPSLGRAIC